MKKVKENEKKLTDAYVLKNNEARVLELFSHARSRNSIPLKKSIREYIDLNVHFWNEYNELKTRLCPADEGDSSPGIKKEEDCFEDKDNLSGINDRKIMFYNESEKMACRYYREQAELLTAIEQHRLECLEKDKAYMSLLREEWLKDFSKESVPSCLMHFNDITDYEPYGSDSHK